MSTVLFASLNTGKGREAKAIAERYGELLVTAEELASQNAGLGTPPEVPEDKDTYRGNALQKAEAFFQWGGLPALADDTGLEVAALSGAPGLYSARYAGEGATFEDNWQKLLQALTGENRREALFRCVLCFYEEKNRYSFIEGTLEGKITSAPRGGAGFGYDPVFEVAGTGKTLAELKEDSTGTPDTHRTRALHQWLSSRQSARRAS